VYAINIAYDNNITFKITELLVLPKIIILHILITELLVLLVLPKITTYKIKISRK
jgi:hypothetical protein